MEVNIKASLTEKLMEILKDPEKTQHTLIQLEKLMRDGATLLTRLADDVESARLTHKNFSDFIARVGLSKEMVEALISKFMGGKK